MLATFSSNVVLAKARTMYGRRLTPENYRDLLKCQTVNEVAAYLKGHTVYSKVLAGIEETGIHRAELEAILKRKLEEEYASLIRYEVTVGEHFSDYFVQRTEIDRILHTILVLDAGTAGKSEISGSGETGFEIPYFLKHSTGIRFDKLKKAGNYDDFLAALERTPYHDILQPFRPGENERTDYTKIEIALFSYLYDNVFEIIRKYTHGDTRRQLLDIFNSYIDLTNFVRIARLKLSYHVEPGEILKAVFPYGTLSQHILEEMSKAGTQEEMQAVLSRTEVGKRAKRVDSTYLDEIPVRVNFRTCRHYIDFSTHPSVVLISYIFFCEAEISDIVTIVEGIRYKLAPPEIKGLLTITGDRERGA